MPKRNRPHIATEKAAAKKAGISLYRWRRDNRPIYYGLSHLLRSGRKKERNIARGIEFAITQAYLRSLLVAQKGLCPLTGVKLRFGSGLDLSNVSLDRLDGKKGYVEGNVRLVCWWTNLARHTLTDAEFKKWCKLVVNYKPPRKRKNP